MSNMVLFVDDEMVQLHSTHESEYWNQADIDQFNEQLIAKDIPIKLYYTTPVGIIPDLWSGNVAALAYITRLSVQRLPHPTKEPLKVTFWHRIQEELGTRGGDVRGDYNSPSTGGYSNPVRVDLITGEIESMHDMPPEEMIKYHDMSTKNYYPTATAFIADEIPNVMELTAHFKGVVAGPDPRANAAVIALRNLGTSSRAVSIETEPGIRFASMGKSNYLRQAIVDPGYPLTADAVMDQLDWGNVQVPAGKDVLLIPSDMGKYTYLPEDMGSVENPIATILKIRDVTWKSLSKIYTHRRGSAAAASPNIIHGTYDESIDPETGQKVRGVYVILPDPTAADVDYGYGMYRLDPPQRSSLPMVVPSKVRFTLLDGEVTAQDLPNTLPEWTHVISPNNRNVTFQVPAGKTGLVFLPFEGNLNTGQLNITYERANALIYQALPAVIYNNPIYLTSSAIGAWSSARDYKFNVFPEYNLPWDRATELFPRTVGGKQVKYWGVPVQGQETSPISLMFDYVIPPDPGALIKLRVQAYSNEDVTNFLTGQSLQKPAPILDQLVNYVDYNSEFVDDNYSLGANTVSGKNVIRYVVNALQPKPYDRTWIIVSIESTYPNYNYNSATLRLVAAKTTI